MGPSERRDVGEKIDRAVEPGFASGSDGVTEMECVPVDHDGGEEIQAGHAVMLSLGGAVADFATELGVKPVTLYRYVSPTGELRENGRRVLRA